MNATLRSIGYISTPYNTLDECPRNIDFEGPLCHLVLGEDYKDGLSGLKPGQNILILYWFENTDRAVMKQGAKDEEKLKGTFALRSPHRPNPIGAAILPIESIEDGIVSLRGLDCLNGTHLLDIKPAIKHENN